MRDTAAAKRYSKAALDSAGDAKEIDMLGSDLASFVEAFNIDEFRKVLIHPAIKLESKREMVLNVSEKLKLSDKCKRILEIVLEKGRISLISEISESFGEMADEKLNRVRVDVTSAYELKKSETDDLKKMFENMTGKTASVSVSVDKSLIGGIVSRIGSKVYDGSLSNQLRLMKVKLEQEA